MEKQIDFQRFLSGLNEAGAEVTSAEFLQDPDAAWTDASPEARALLLEALGFGGVDPDFVAITFAREEGAPDDLESLRVVLTADVPDEAAPPAAEPAPDAPLDATTPDAEAEIPPAAPMDEPDELADDDAPAFGAADDAHPHADPADELAAPDAGEPPADDDPVAGREADLAAAALDDAAAMDDDGPLPDWAEPIPDDDSLLQDAFVAPNADAAPTREPEAEALADLEFGDAAEPGASADAFVSDGTMTEDVAAAAAFTSPATEAADDATGEPEPADPPAPAESTAEDGADVEGEENAPKKGLFSRLSRKRKTKDAPAAKAPVSGIATVVKDLAGPHLEEVERYAVQEPYAFVRIVHDKEAHEHTYEVIEPELSERESNVLEFIEETMVDLIEIGLSEFKEGEAADLLRKKMDEIIYDYSIVLSPLSKEKLLYYLLRDFLGFGILDPIMRDEMIEDVSCDGPGVPIFLYHRKYESIKSNVTFRDHNQLDSYVIRMAQRSGKHVSIAEPLLDATLPDGSRLNATLSTAVTANGSTFTIRKFKEDPFTPPDLVRFGTMNMDILAYWWMAVQNGASAIYAGGTASGKTTSLNAILLFIPPQMKIVSIEDTREVNLPHLNWIAGVTRAGYGPRDSHGRQAGEIDMFTLLKAALRQRPEYILVGEVRGAEANALFQAMATGHTAYGTMHADSVESVIHRLESEPISIPRSLLEALDIVSVQIQTRIGDKRVRRSKEIVEIVGLDPHTREILTNEVFTWDPATDEYEYSGVSYVLERIQMERNLTPGDIQRELTNRKELIRYMIEVGLRDIRTVSKIIVSYYKAPDSLMARVRAEMLERGIPPMGADAHDEHDDDFDPASLFQGEAPTLQLGLGPDDSPQGEDPLPTPPVAAPVDAPTAAPAWVPSFVVRSGITAWLARLPWELREARAVPRSLTSWLRALPDVPEPQAWLALDVMEWLGGEELEDVAPALDAAVPTLDAAPAEDAAYAEAPVADAFASPDAADVAPDAFVAQAPPAAEPELPVDDAYAEPFAAAEDALLEPEPAIEPQPEPENQSGAESLPEADALPETEDESAHAPDPMPERESALPDGAEPAPGIARVADAAPTPAKPRTRKTASAPEPTVPEGAEPAPGVARVADNDATQETEASEDAETPEARSGDSGEER